jgi:pimeloyl-ACP methyl ester carboxylesterase
MNATSNEDTSERKALRLRANKMITSNFTNMVRMSFANLFGPKSKTFFKKEIELAVSEALLTPMQGYIAAQEGMQLRANRNHVLTENSFKKLLIIGKKDPVLDFETSLNEAKKTNSAIVVFQNGHMPHIENKLALNDALREFMKIC